jgi:hypothetical protein
MCKEAFCEQQKKTTRKELEEKEGKRGRSAALSLSLSLSKTCTEGAPAEMNTRNSREHCAATDYLVTSRGSLASREPISCWMIPGKFCLPKTRRTPDEDEPRHVFCQPTTTTFPQGNVCVFVVGRTAHVFRFAKRYGTYFVVARFLSFSEEGKRKKQKKPTMNKTNSFTKKEGFYSCKRSKRACLVHDMT